MLVLSIDTAANHCAVALCDETACLASIVETITQGHAQKLVPLIVQVLQQAGKSFPDLDGIAVTQGPGSFTGVRVGIATAKGLGLALAKPVIGIDSFAAFLKTAPATNLPTLVVLDSRRAELYAQFFDASGVETGAPVCLLPEDIARLAPQGALAVCGNVVDAMKPCLADRAGIVFHPGPPGPDIRVVAAMAIARLRNGDAVPTLYAAYVRPPDVSLPK